MKNLQEINPSITHDSLSQAIKEEFFNRYQDRCEVQELDFKELQKIPTLDKAYQEMKDWTWRFGETPDFEHNLETRFDWGIIDLYMQSEDGKITGVQLYSDTLYPQLVDEVKFCLTGVTYDKQGINQAVERTKEIMINRQEPPETVKYLDEFKKWLVESI